MDNVQTIKIGEKEYSQDELSKLVGLGETAQEYEAKWNRPIKDFYPDYTQKSQKLAEFEKKETEYKATQDKLESDKKDKELAERAKSNQLSAEEQRDMARREAQDLGLVTMDRLEEEVGKRVEARLAAKQLIEETSSVIATASEKGQPKTSPQELLKFMDENGLKSPEKAYKLMFEPEIDKWKEDKIKGIKPAGFDTQSGMGAGGKQPPPPSPIHSKEDLSKAIREGLTRSSGSGI